MTTIPREPVSPPALERKIALSRWALAFERAWPWVWLPIGIAGLFLIASLGGVWPLLSSGPHQLLLAGFGLAALASTIPLLRLPYPSRRAGLERLESLSGLPHRPASSYEDGLAQDVPASSQTSTLWAAHRIRLAGLIARLKPRPPRPRMEAADPLALRALLLLALTATGIAAGDAFSDKLAAAFRFGPATVATPTRLDAWVTPPAYTGRQPIVLADGQQTPASSAESSSRKIEVPQGSVLTIRAAGPEHAAFAVASSASGTSEPVAIPEQAKSDPSSLLSEFRDQLDTPATVRVLDGGALRQTWQFQVIANTAPKITLTKDPEQTQRGGLVLDYRATDDYGIASAAASFALAEAALSKPLKLADGSQIDALGEAPKKPLKLTKSASMKDVKGHTSLDLAAHLWAGLKVKMTLTATDRAGLTGTSEPAPFLLPERQFRNPLARALVEQRRKLAFLPGDYLDVRYALDALAIAPEDFPLAPGAYLSLRSVYRQLTETPSKELFEGVADQLWALALKLEDGELSQAAQSLKDAEDKLSEAIENGASEAEIKQLMNQLRQALNQYLQSLAQQGQDKQLSQDSQQLNPQDLEQMLKRMEQMAETGNKDAAQQMLSQLKDMLDQLQAGKMPGGGKSGQMRQMLDKFGNLIGKQKKLLDDTFKSGRDRNSGDQQGQGQKGKPGKGGDSGSQDGDTGDLSGLDQRQGDLRGELNKLMEQLNGAGQKSPEQLDGAGQSMGDAQQSLQNEDTDSATQNQGKALDQLRKGAAAMAEQMQKGQGQQGRNGGNQGRDPLGRPTGQDSNDGLDEGAELPLDQTNVQRSREIIQELRRRLGEATRPPGELDYLERLLK